jgi:hypothetical protein
VQRRLAPETIRKIVFDIRAQRESLTIRERWAQTQPESETRTQIFREIDFWRRQLTAAEEALGRE